MSLTTKVTRNLGNNYVQVDVQSSKAETRYFKVPKNKADIFCSQYIKRDKRDSLISNTAFIGSTLIGCLGAALLTQKLKSTSLRITTGILAGIGSAVGANIATTKIMSPKHQEFVKSFGAQEIYYDDNKLPI